VCVCTCVGVCVCVCSCVGVCVCGCVCVCVCMCVCLCWRGQLSHWTFEYFMMARIVLDRLTFPCAAKYPACVPCATQTRPTPRLVSLRSWRDPPHHRQPLMLQTQATPPRATTRGRGQATQCRLCRRGRVLQRRSHVAASWQRVRSGRCLRPPWQHVVVLCRRKAWRRRHLWRCRV
jgi:hypothetical protein